MKKIAALIMTTMIVAVLVASTLKADPCGMVPPIWTGGQSPITRIGLQKTYVFHKDGVETFVIRPGFSGNVDNFGMLIPFPSPPELRKVPDSIFEQVANAVDPPEVVVDLRIQRMMMRRGALAAPTAEAADSSMQFAAKNEVVVLKEEAVGMYEVAVLEAGSAFALKKWMDKNGYQYPEGMDKVTNDYVDQGWCFVAVKTKVGQEKGVQPKAGQRKVQAELPKGSVFDGNVQGMGFRFKSPELVVPMRLSAFNDGELRNVMYLLTEGPRKIRAIPEEYVVRQISGKQLFDNVTQPLPLRIIGGTEKDIPAFRRQSLPKLRDPEPKNGLAKDLFASDLLAVSTGELSLRHEEQEKELLRIGEYFGLRGEEVDKENGQALVKARKKTVEDGLAMLKEMTLTVVDGDFPREVISQQNLTFAEYDMPRHRNNNVNYDANLFGPGQKKDGVLKFGQIQWLDVEKQIARDHSRTRIGLRSLIGFGILGMIGTLVYRKPKALLIAGIMVGMLVGTAMANGAAVTSPISITDDTAEIIAKLENSKTSSAAIKAVADYARESESNRETIIKELLNVVRTHESISRRGWAIAALTEIGGQDVDEYLLDVHTDSSQEQIVRTWAAAARVKMTRTINGLIEKANLIQKFPPIGRPIGLRIIEKMNSDGSDVNVEKVLGVTQTVPQLTKSLAPTIMAFGPEKLINVMATGKDQNVRRMAAAYLGTIAQRGEADKIAELVSEHYRFDNDAKQVPWHGGPLFVPGIAWSQGNARKLVGNLMRWYVWCDVNEKGEEQKQIHNNIRSLALARAAGYQSAGWQEAGVTQWLKAWSAVVGHDGVLDLLKEQGLDKDRRYTSF